MVEEVELVGEGLGDVVVARVESIDPIEGADKIRRIGVDDGSGPVEVVCGAWNFEVGDLVSLWPRWVPSCPEGSPSAVGR